MVLSNRSCLQVLESTSTGKQWPTAIYPTAAVPSAICPTAAVPSAIYATTAVPPQLPSPPLLFPLSYIPHHCCSLSYLPHHCCSLLYATCPNTAVLSSISTTYTTVMSPDMVPTVWYTPLCWSLLCWGLGHLSLICLHGWALVKCLPGTCT